MSAAQTLLIFSVMAKANLKSNQTEQLFGVDPAPFDIENGKVVWGDCRKQLIWAEDALSALTFVQGIYGIGESDEVKSIDELNKMKLEQFLGYVENKAEREKLNSKEHADEPVTAKLFYDNHFECHGVLVTHPLLPEPVTSSRVYADFAIFQDSWKIDCDYTAESIEEIYKSGESEGQIVAFLKGPDVPAEEQVEEALEGMPADGSYYLCAFQTAEEVPVEWWDTGKGDLGLCVVGLTWNGTRLNRWMPKFSSF